MHSSETALRLRLFIAMPIPEAVKAEMEKVQARLRQSARGEGIRWVKSEQFHLTLQFLGAVDQNRAGALIDATRAACRGCVRFSLQARGLGFFPDDRRLRVIWAGIRSRGEELAVLQSRIAANTADFAENPDDRPFSAHLTLARIKHIRPSDAWLLVDRVRSLEGHVCGGWIADRVEIMRSELRPAGSHYTCLSEIPLTEG